MRALVVLAPCACVDFIMLFQLADLGPGLDLGGLSHFFWRAARAFRSLVVLAPCACVPLSRWLGTPGDYRILFSRILYKHTGRRRRRAFEDFTEQGQDNGAHFNEGGGGGVFAEKSTMGLAFEMAVVVLNKACASSKFSDMLLPGCFRYHALPTRRLPL